MKGRRKKRIDQNQNIWKQRVDTLYDKTVKFD